MDLVACGGFTDYLVLPAGEGVHEWLEGNIVNVEFVLEFGKAVRLPVIEGIQYHSLEGGNLEIVRFLTE